MKKSMKKVMLINPETKSITFETMEHNPESCNEYYRLIGCDCVTVVYLHEDENIRIVLWVDDEGLLKPEIRDFFKFKLLNSQWYAGRGVITVEYTAKMDDDGNCPMIDADKILKIDKIINDMSWLHADDEESRPQPQMLTIAWNEK